MALLHSGVDWAVIALWLGHEALETTQMSLHASLALTQQALEKTTPVHGRPGRYPPDDARFAFLKGRSSCGVTCALRPEIHPIVQRDSAFFETPDDVANAELGISGTPMRRICWKPASTCA
jgi:hypothetical protein